MRLLTNLSVQSGGATIVVAALLGVVLCGGCERTAESIRPSTGFPAEPPAEAVVAAGDSPSPEAGGDGRSMRASGSLDAESERAAGEPSPLAIELAPGLVVDRAADEVRFAAIVCLRNGWLEQLVCTPGTREHESIFVTAVTPSLIHAALILLDLDPGAPGSWRLEDDRIVDVPPTGAPLEAFVRFAPLGGTSGGESGEDAAVGAVAPDDETAPETTPATARETGHEPGGHSGAEWQAGATVPLGSLVHDVATGRALEAPRFLFSGSALHDPERLPPGIPPYVADYSGSVIGLVTFGDELIALPMVRPDQVDVAPAEWIAWTARIPPLGTEATVILRPVRRAGP